MYDLNARLVRVISDAPLQEVLPKGFMAVAKGKRYISWRKDQPATLYYVEALDEGDPEIEVPYRDAILQWQAPFNTKPQRLTQIKNRYAGVLWGNATTAVIYDRWWNNRNAKTYVFDPSKSNSTARILSDRNYQDRYSDPGDFVTQKGKFGETVLTLEGSKAFLLGEGFSEKGQFPFLDQIDLSSLQTNRLYQSAYTDKYEQLYDYNPKTKNQGCGLSPKVNIPIILFVH